MNKRRKIEYIEEEKEQVDELLTYVEATNDKSPASELEPLFGAEYDFWPIDPDM